MRLSRSGWRQKLNNLQPPRVYLLVAAVVLAGCRGPQTATALPVSAHPPPIAPTLPPPLPPPPGPTIGFPPAPTDTAPPLPTPTPTPDPYSGLYVDDLRARGYGGGEIALVQKLAGTRGFTRTPIA